ncbi:hypothetical protein EON65_18725 [archaeon]|nr:MAG: hypothetical protein EON65_18725 [archaeon]
MNTILIFGLIRLFFITGLAACLNCSSSSTRSTYFKKGTLLLQTAKKSSAYLSGNNTAIFSKRTLPTLSYNLSLTHTMLERAFSDDKQAAEWLAYVSSQGLTHHHPHVHMLAKAGLMLLKRVGLAGVKRNDSAAEELGQELFVHLRDYVTTSRPLDKVKGGIMYGMFMMLVYILSLC